MRHFSLDTAFLLHAALAPIVVVHSAVAPVLAAGEHVRCSYLAVYPAVWAQWCDVDE